MTILVVDDEPSIREIIKRYMEESGYTVFNAPDGHYAMDADQIPHSQIDFILLDLNIPDENSYTLAEDLMSRCPHAYRRDIHGVLHRNSLGTE